MSSNTNKASKSLPSMSSGMLPLYICPCDIFPASGLLGEKTVLARADKVTAADFHIVSWLACALWGASGVAVEDLKSCFRSFEIHLLLRFLPTSATNIRTDFHTTSASCCHPAMSANIRDRGCLLLPRFGPDYPKHPLSAPDAAQSSASTAPMRRQLETG